MSFIDRLRELAYFPLVHLASGPITPVSILVSLFILIGAWLIASFAGRALTRALARREVVHGASFALAKITRYAIILIGALAAVMSLGVRLDALLAASTVLLVGIGFGLQNIAQNFISGLILLVERPVARGDFVQVGTAFGSVVDVGMRATRVVTRDEVTILVPNSELITAQVINHSVPTTNLRIAVHVGVAYGSSSAHVRDVLLAIAGADTELLPAPAAEVRLDNFGESTIDFSLLVWIADPRLDLRTASRLRFAIDAAFRAEHIEMPFPQRDVYLRDGRAPREHAAPTPPAPAVERPTERAPVPET